MWLGPRRPGIGWISAIGVLAVFVWRGVWVGGIATALVVVAVHPPASVAIAIFIVLTIAFGLFFMRTLAPAWFAWLVGRTDAPRSRDPFGR